MKLKALVLALAIFVGAVPSAQAQNPKHELVAVTTTATGATVPTQGVCTTAIVWSASTSTSTTLFEQSADGTTWYTVGTFTDPSSTATSIGAYYAKFSRLRVSARAAGTISGDLSWTPCTIIPSNITSINRVTITQPATSATLTIANGKTFTVSNTLTLTGTDGRSHAFPATNSTVARTDAGQTFTGTQVFGTLSATRMLSTGTAPAVAGTTSNSCGTGGSPSIVGKDLAAVITVGGTSATSCTVTFNVAFANAPVCVANASATTAPLNVTTTTTTAVISAAALTVAEKIYLACHGY